MTVELRRVALPDFGIPVERPSISAAEYASRAGELYASADLDWVIVYGDQWHFGNVMWLTGYDPRFEETLLVLGKGGSRTLVVGIEGVAYSSVAGLSMDVRFYHPFSILGQPREDSPRLNVLLEEIGLATGDSVGIVGWKTPDTREVDDVTAPAFVPAVIVELIESVTGERSIDITKLMTDPGSGLRNRNSATQIAIFEWGAARSSAQAMRVVRGARPGMTEYEAAGLLGFQGEPYTVYPIVSASDGAINGLRSPSSRVISEGEAITVGVGIWGGLTCRAGVMTASPDVDFLNNLALPYFRAISTWWSAIRIGLTGGEMHETIAATLSGEAFESFVNAGHLTSYEEWVDSPVRAENSQRFSSGMVLQCDIIPSTLPSSQTINCEDTLALADQALRSALERHHPELWQRIIARRRFMIDQLGIPLHPEVLPLSSMPAYLPPAWLAPDLVCVNI